MFHVAIGNQFACVDAGRSGDFGGDRCHVVGLQAEPESPECQFQLLADFKACGDDCGIDPARG